MKRGCPSLALGGGARKDHLFEENRSLCDRYAWGGGREVDPDDVDGDDEGLCKECRRALGVVA